MDMPVICVWVHHPNDIRSNRVYSAYVDAMYFAEDPFQSVTIDTTPCWARRAQ
jgi:hypothetical protein